MSKVEACVETAKSMVIVKEIDGTEYCSGFIAITEARQGTYVVTDAEFVMDRKDNLMVFFSDNTELPASFIETYGPFCFLKTKFHPACEQIELMEANITPSPVIIFPPSSSASFYYLPSFVILESTESYYGNFKCARIGATDQIPGSGTYFVVNCHYSENTSDGHDRLSTCPVYTLSGSVMGIILSSDPKFTWEKLAFSAKCVSNLINLLRTLLPRNKKHRDGYGSSGTKKKRDGDGSSRTKKKRDEDSSSGNKKKRDRDSSSRTKKKRDGDGSSENKKKRDGDGSSMHESAENKRSKGGDGSSKKLAGNKSSSNSISKGMENKGPGHKCSSKGKMGGCEISSKVKESTANKTTAGDKGKGLAASKR
ncbi:unnamed protein product [Triticum turgidum subsp. durum]|uniref:Uncharacterized protein n=1 Tax=Triticum turgidum subsp. durum TaxID=4567 RepID=A0A9R1BB35_TRITD|nr:unnamed protein product [Triticum turgidum subsp. durum]